MTIKIPPGLKPTTFLPRNGTLEAVPLQRHGLGFLHWNAWALLPLALAGAALATPYLVTHQSVLGLAMQRGFALVCHQRFERSFSILGASIAVCARCLGIYVGAMLGLVFRTTRSIALRLLLVAAALNLLDAESELAGLHANWLGVRSVLGLSLGATATLLISSSTTETKRYVSSDDANSCEGNCPETLA